MVALDVVVLDMFGDGSRLPPAPLRRERIRAAMARPALFDSLRRHLVTQGYEMPREKNERDVRMALEPSVAVQQVLLRVCRDGGEAAQVCERFIDRDEGVQEWRYRQMVERMIGARPGTGGSAGAQQLTMCSRLPTAEQRRWSHLECPGHLLDGLQRWRSLATLQHGHVGDRDANAVGEHLP